jgi:large subunit ribosomal protein L19
MYLCASLFWTLSNFDTMHELEAIQFVHSQLLTKQAFPEFRTGDTVVVTYKIVEGDKTREQDYRGDVIQIKGHGETKTFTVRKISHGVGVERIFSITNPNIAAIQVVKRGRVRRARLYYLRGLVGKKARIKELKRG